MASKTLEVDGFRWWEYYFIRYFVGAVMGSFVVLWFDLYSGSPLRGFLSLFLGDAKSAGVDRLVLLAVLGLTYCYVASAPVLVIHAVRGLFRYGPVRSLRLKIAGVVGFCVVLSVLSLVLFMALGIALFWLPVAGVVVLQWALMFLAMGVGAARVIVYYRSLAKARARPHESIAEYVQSYRHLREHGNAFVIVGLELVLAVAIVHCPDWVAVWLLCLVWIIPAASVWFIATLLESKTGSVSRLA